MKKLALQLKNEHEEIKKVIFDLNSLIDAEEINYPFTKRTIKALNKLWNSHEKNEEKLFKSKIFELKGKPLEKMIIEQHRELRGHWKIIEMALNSGDEKKLRVALDTDGRMLSSKLSSHIDEENKIFEKIIRS